MEIIYYVRWDDLENAYLDIYGNIYKNVTELLKTLNDGIIEFE